MLGGWCSEREDGGRPARGVCASALLLGSLGTVLAVTFLAPTSARTEQEATENRVETCRTQNGHQLCAPSHCRVFHDLLLHCHY